MVSDVAEQAAARHELCYQNVAFFILIVVDDLQHISTLALSDLLQQLDLLKSLAAGQVMCIQAVFINDLNRDF